jgi:hypothetical protein
MRSSTWRGLLAALSALLLFFVAACGDDGDDATDVVEDVDDGDTDDDTDAPDPADDGDDATDGDGEGAFGLGGDFCAQVSDADRFFSSFDDESDVQDPAEVSAMIRQARDTLDAIDPPAEIAADWNQLVGAVGELADLFERVDFSDPQSFANLEDDPELLEEFMTIEQRFEGVEEAGDRVADYVREECGIELD